MAFDTPLRAIVTIRTQQVGEAYRKTTTYARNVTGVPPAIQKSRSASGAWTRLRTSTPTVNASAAGIDRPRIPNCGKRGIPAIDAAMQAGIGP